MGSFVCLIRTRETVQAFVVVLAMKILSKLPSFQPVPLYLLLEDGGSCVLKGSTIPEACSETAPSSSLSSPGGDVAVSHL